MNILVTGGAGYIGSHTYVVSLDVFDCNRQVETSSFQKNLKSVVREISAYAFRKNVLDNKNTTPRLPKKKGGSQKGIKPKMKH